ncbi:aminotransferase class III-fold pyridoxal phosphate-dependent enzyme [Streptomyces sp. AC495_CC817]|uniref:aminotransferase class III-fold pyridoxal phosphate-dependent enzyme n=1 Tax=Streptomyces sp. AC495_CC817 TaxID=2823900 RepID=UPI001C276F88|nr:aminotransferase class III-fold pyridoxal phosphate-dependent enzyme [Streptomyces sp. AC495_CC817]
MPDLVDITTTSVGRDTLLTTYSSFFDNVSYSGSYRVVVTVDPAYGVEEKEVEEVIRFLDALPKRYPQVHEVVVERLPKQIGLQGALSLLFAHAKAPVGVHVEDDWRFTAPVDLDVLISDLYAQDSTQIVLTNSHVARGGTFERPEEVQEVAGTSGRLLRLNRSSWAAHYLPLCPHLHRTDRWAPTVAKALALTDGLQCPDERVRERVIAEQATDQHNVLWTRDVVAEDLGREWLARRARYKAITSEHAGEAETGSVTRRSGDAPLVLRRSASLRSRAEELIPGMTQTFQKRPGNFAEGEYPVYAERGRGSKLWDVDGNAYVDFVMALGAASLGYDHPAMSNVIRERLGRGVLLSLPAQAEITAAEELVRAVPGVEMVRFLKTGAEACSASLRLARHITERDRVLLAGYHGWHDQLGGPSTGVPVSAAQLGERFALDSPDDDSRFLAAVRDRGEQLAAIVLSTPYHRVLSTEFLNELRAACDEEGCLLVLDEIVTGFRLAPGGLGQFHGVRADILCFSKGIAGGMPLAAVAGPRHLMEQFAGLRVSTTFGGELLSLEAMKVALREYERTDYYQHIATLGRRLREGINGHAARLGFGDVVTGYDPMPCLHFDTDSEVHHRMARKFLAEMARRGFLLRRDVNFISATHTSAQIDDAVSASAEALGALAG